MIISDTGVQNRKDQVKMKLEKLPQTKIIFMRRTGIYSLENNKLMESIKEWLTVHDFLNENAVILSIAQDDPKETAPEKCRYDVGLVVSDFPPLADSKILSGEIESGSYAVFPVEYTATAVAKAWATIFDILADYGYSIDQTKPVLERYTAEMIAEHLCKICIPIELLKK